MLIPRLSSNKDNKDIEPKDNKIHTNTLIFNQLTSTNLYTELLSPPLTKRRIHTTTKFR